MNDWEDLYAAQQAASEALAGAEEGLLAELADAKAAFRKDKSAKNEQRHAAAVEAVRQYRSIVRANRAGVGVIADQADQGGEG